MDENPAVIFTTTHSFYVDSDVDASSNYEYWVTAVDHNGNESDASSIVEISGSMLSTAADLLPDAFALNQNYPNPFNPSTRIPFSLQEPANVSIAIFSVLGQPLEVITKGVFSAGVHTVDWHPRAGTSGGLAGGVYFIRMMATPVRGGRAVVQTQRAVYVR